MKQFWLLLKLVRFELRHTKLSRVNSKLKPLPAISFHFSSHSSIETYSSDSTIYRWCRLCFVIFFNQAIQANFLIKFRFFCIQLLFVRLKQEIQRHVFGGRFSVILFQSLPVIQFICCWLFECHMHG